MGGTYRFWSSSDADFVAIGRNYLRAVRHMVEVYRASGIRIRLTAEPEPDTTFETAEDVIELFEQFMLPQLETELAKPLGVDRAEGERLLREFFNVNLDVCHQSVLFRDPVEEWRQLESRGLRVGKLHLTSALVAQRPSEQLDELLAFDEPRYLHQFAWTDAAGAIHRGRDLPQLPSVNLDAVEEVRCHFHVPLSAQHIGTLSTTREDTSRALQHALNHEDPPQLAIETYTWPLLIGANHEQPNLADGIVAEYAWVLDQVS